MKNEKYLLQGDMYLGDGTFQTVDLFRGTRRACLDKGFDLRSEYGEISVWLDKGEYLEHVEDIDPCWQG